MRIRYERPERGNAPLLASGDTSAWAWDVGLNGRPHDLGNISAFSANRPDWKITSAGWGITSIVHLMERP